MKRFRALGLAIAAAAVVLLATTSDAFAAGYGRRGHTTVLYTTQYVPVVRVYPTYPPLTLYPYPYTLSYPASRFVFTPFPY
jgi:hypothetical protein